MNHEAVLTEEVARLTSNQNLLVLVCLAGRPGVRRFITYLEYTHYSPFDETGLNDKFQLILMTWQGMHYMVAVIPMVDKPKAEEMAKSCGMRLADGFPVMIGGPGGPDAFPLRTPNVFTIENEKNSPLYHGQAEQMLREEAAELEEFFKKQDLRAEGN